MNTCVFDNTPCGGAVVDDGPNPPGPRKHHPGSSEGLQGRELKALGGRAGADNEGRGGGRRMTTPAPDPIYVGHLPWMPLKRKKLRDSVAWIKAKQRPELGFYMLNIWMAAWESEECAASLENNDLTLANHAECTIEKWSEIRDDVLHKFELCNDGRLYHPVIYEMACEALDFRRREKSKIKKRYQRAKGQEGTRRGQKGTKRKLSPSVPPLSPVVPTKQETKNIPPYPHDVPPCPGAGGSSRPASDGPRSEPAPDRRSEPDLSGGLSYDDRTRFRLMWLNDEWDGHLETRPDRVPRETPDTPATDESAPNADHRNRTADKDHADAEPDAAETPQDTADATGGGGEDPACDAGDAPAAGPRKAMAGG